jgi:anaerobic selenocysteine-containing dehydrogenase
MGAEAMTAHFKGPSRRAILAGIGAAGGLAGVDSYFPAIAAAAKAAKSAASAAAPAIQRLKSNCAICPNFCGIEATVVNGIVRTIYPDAARADFYNHGICPKGASGMYNMYDPYRLKKPLKRTNPKKGPNENPKWVEITWDEAFSIVAGRLKKVKAEDPRKLIWQHGQGKYLIQEQCCKAFTEAFGTPNMVHRTTTCEAARHVADDLAFGSNGIIPDLGYSKLLLNFGANYFEGEQTSRWLDYTATMGREKNGLKTIVVEPRLSVCAAKADEWVPVRPGKDLAVLLGMAREMIAAGTIDEPFLVNYTNAADLVGADGKVLKSADGKASLVWDTATQSAKPFTADVKPALKGSYTVDGNSVRTALQVFADSVEAMTPQAAEEISGVPAATIVRLAQTFAKEARIGETIVIDGQTLRYRPAVIYSFRGLEAKEFGVQNWSAGLMLNMLVGSPDAVGGLKLNSPYATPAYFEASKCEYPPNRADLRNSVYYPHSNHDIAQTAQLVALDPKAYGLPYVPEVQIFYATNRPVAIADSWKQFEGLTKTFNVVIDVVMSESAWYADIVLPDKTYLESWHFAPTRGTPEASHMAIRQPMANPFNLEHDGWSILWELAKRLDIRDKFAAELNKSWGLKDPTFQSGRDYSPREAVEVIWADKTKQPFSVALEKGFVGRKLDVKARYLTGVEDKFKGPGKPKMKFYRDQLIATYEKVEGIVKKNDIKNIDLAKYKVALSPIPIRDHAFPTPHREAADYPFYIVTHKLMWRNQSAFTANNAITNQALGPDAATNFVTINTVTAKQLGIKSGDQVMIETRVGKVKGTANVIEGVRPDTIAVSYSYGTFSPGLSPGARKGTFINQVLEYHPDIVSGMVSFNDTKCKLAKA